MISVTGVKEIDDVFKTLPQAVTHQIMGAAHLKAAAPLIKRESYLAPEGPTGNLRDSIGGVKLSLSKATVVGEVRVGPQRRGGKKGFAGHLVEFGTKQRANKNGANRGRMKAHPFAKPAFDQTKSLIESGIAVEVAKSVIRKMKYSLKGNFNK